MALDGMCWLRGRELAAGPRADAPHELLPAPPSLQVAGVQLALEPGGGARGVTGAPLVPFGVVLMEY